MMAALLAARRGRSVVILEGNDRTGKKLSGTGNGHCNFTNLTARGSSYHSENPAFADAVVKHMPPRALIHFFRELGIEIRCRGNYVYPLSDEARTVTESLMRALSSEGVEILYQMKASSIERKGRGFFVSAGDRQFQADAVILATGSKAFPVSGSDGSGYHLAETAGHRIVPVVPALCGLKCRGSFFKMLSGVRQPARILLKTNDFNGTEEGEIQFTDYGISGIAVFQLSRFASYALSQGGKAQAWLDFLPGFSLAKSGKELFLSEEPAFGEFRTGLKKEGKDESSLTEEELLRYFQYRRKLLSEWRAEDFLKGIFHEKLAAVLLKEAGAVKGMASGITDQQLKKIAALSLSFPLDISENNGFEKAQTAAGGVDTREVNPDTMESLLMPGLFFAGEILDVDGPCGGYNLEFAFASGYTAGMSV